MLHICVKRFQELSNTELYGILQLRSEVFVVEQQCVYQDLDGKDQKALHVIGHNGGNVLAYTRIFGPGDYVETASIGRVVVRASERKYGYGKEIMKASINAVEQHFGEKKIHVSAQLYLERFYHELGFEQIGKGYLEDGIPHIGMLKQ
ncbi:GNAT family N-acetyltransferase [Ulvibacterium marinum]|uniref:GNAT family N-acetyltransferase n=1 Tax=Ulvibacterium marinum TaxID=2419782 RepID=UPI0024957708|nr:GNAT family N-acetyltransferase [Ulvibacterium marinum]